jgi:predicted  nucleic acid-binding Zn-ribbon protein
MKDIAREKYAKLMDEIERIEDLVAEVEGQDSPDADELIKLKDELAVKRNELARISDGCGKSHSH